MDWMTLHGIALGVARGLEYLHHGCKTRIVYFDIKPHNVLLDDNFCPKLSDFGLAKLCEKKESILSMLDTRGTIGYIAPELFSRMYGQVSHKSDVYSYGMLVLEMIGARNNKRADQNSASNASSMYFPEWIYKDLEKGNIGRNNRNVITSEEEEIAKKMALVGLWCIQPSPSDRPLMNRVVEMMEGSVDALEVRGLFYAVRGYIELQSQPFSCGNQNNLLYPFWKPGREDCGHPDFKLDCNREIAELSISSAKFRILEPNYYSPIIRLARSDYIGNLCPKDPSNVPFDESVLPLAANTTLLTIYYDCRQDFSGNVSIPASGPALDTLQNVPTPDNLKRALEEGFELGPSQNCSACIDAGGACGFNRRSSTFACYYMDGTRNKGRSTGVIRGIAYASGSVAIILIAGGLFCHISQRRKTSEVPRQLNLKTLIPLEHYNYTQVKKITKSFAEVVGKGGFGTVYRGTLCDGRKVSVKVLNDTTGNGEDFVNEVASMSKKSHVNVVTLLGFCAEGTKRAILYEFLENGSLDKYISSKRSSDTDWMELYGIALGVARGLEYLHHGCRTRIVHFDIKPHNVLLDGNLCPKVSDFGHAKLCERKESILSLLDTRGTIGYIAPEVFSRMYGRVSHKSDVYSYGMLVLEMIGARTKTSSEDTASSASSVYFPE
ncbi:hypothetical protein Bca4012_027209 [Brassica carinata]